MKKYKIIYRGRSLIHPNGKARTEDLLFPFYWSEETEGWRNFDGEIIIENADINGCSDGAIITLKIKELTEIQIEDELFHNREIASVYIQTPEGWEKIR